jgi:hypothetical protein
MRLCQQAAVAVRVEPLDQPRDPYFTPSLVKTNRGAGLVHRPGRRAMSVLIGPPPGSAKVT